MSEYRALMIGEKAPHFTANTTYGPINFPEDYKGKWVILFSHPGDFTPVCTTELMTFASMSSDFAKNGCALLGLSVDSNPSHIDWARTMETYTWKKIKKPKIDFPIIADDFGKIATLYGMLMPSVSTTKTVRSVFFIDPNGVIRAIFMYPLTTGRNMDEIMRTLLALQAYDKTGYATPADWMPGDPQIMPAPQTMDDAAGRLAKEKEGAFSCLDWYLCFTQGSKPDAMAQKSIPVVQTVAKVESAPKESINEMPQTAKIEKTPYDAAPKKVGTATDMNMSKLIAEIMSAPKKEPLSASKTVLNPAGNPKFGFDDGIVAQNRMLFGNDNPDMNDHLITRDYPNGGM